MIVQRTLTSRTSQLDVSVRSTAGAGDAARAWSMARHSRGRHGQREEAIGFAVLDVSDYELEGVEVDPEGDRARVTSRMRWTRLPSPSMKDERVTSDFIYREGQWLLEKQHGGPFDGTLP